MSDSDLPLRRDSPSGAGESLLDVHEVIARAQRLVDSPRPVDGYPLAWYVEALHAGDLTVIAAAALRGGGSEATPGSR